MGVGVGLQGVGPLVTVLGVSPRLLMRRKIMAGDLAERDGFHHRPLVFCHLGLSLGFALGQWVYAGSDLLDQLTCHLAGVGQRDFAVAVASASQTHLAHLRALRRVAKQPELSTGGSDQQI